MLGVWWFVRVVFVLSCWCEMLGRTGKFDGMHGGTRSANSFTSGTPQSKSILFDNGTSPYFFFGFAHGFFCIVDCGAWSDFLGPQPHAGGASVLKIQT